jgi:starch synthase (maltosyl-transferring)
MVDEVKQLLLTFAKFEKDGTLPNTIHGNDVSNRDTSDAPLWFAVACEEFGGTGVAACLLKKKMRQARPCPTLPRRADSIAENYARGTPNGIRMDADSALIWSPSHFTWMDTNFPPARRAKVIRSKFKFCGSACCGSLKKSAPKFRLQAAGRQIQIEAA